MSRRFTYLEMFRHVQLECNVVVGLKWILFVKLFRWLYERKTFKFKNFTNNTRQSSNARPNKFLLKLIHYLFCNMNNVHIRSWIYCREFPTISCSFIWITCDFYFLFPNKNEILSVNKYCCVTNDVMTFSIKKEIWNNAQ